VKENTMDEVTRRAVAELAADSVAGGRWTARRGLDSWYVEDDAGRVVCETTYSAVAKHIAANDPAFALSSTTDYQPAREASGNALYLDEDGTVQDLPSFIAAPRDWRPLFVAKPQP
jgi:hypothetical protein